MLASSVINVNQKDIMRKTLTYKSKSGSIKNKCLDIASEANFFYGKGTTTRAYETDNLGRLTKVTDALFGNHTYSYDEKGYLKKEDETDFTYDANGNITQAGTKKYEYSGTIKDRLTKALGYDVGYNDISNPGNPTSWNGRTYGWDRSRRLVLFQNNGTYTSYSYNAEGLRTSKTLKSTTEYFYSGDRLIAEKNPIYKLNFLYDENGLLYGFVKDNSTKYFYIRDVYQNILGIVDNTGAIVVKYSYDAWGNHKVLNSSGNENTANGFIGNINPFRYKGYYYDNESNMFYCKSRYYNPEWCRWLNADNTAYLNPQNIYELNLFCYCKNDLVMYVDPSGYFTILGLLISVGLSLLFEVVEDAIDGNGMDHDWKDYLGAGISGVFGAFGGNILMRGTFAVAGGLIDGWLSGDIAENGIGNTLLSIGISFGIGEIASGVSKFVSNKIQINKLTNDAVTNRGLLKSLGIKYSFNQNGKSINAFTKAITSSDWTSKMISDYVSSGIASGVSQLILNLC